MRETTLALLATKKPGTRIEVRLTFRAGGRKCTTDRNELRGYYISMRPEEELDGMVTYVAFSGGSCLVETAPRFNQKRLGALAAELPMTDAYRNCVQRVLDRNGLELEPDQTWWQQAEAIRESLPSLVPA